MDLVVTGATSFLGAALIKEALLRGHQVYAVARPGSANLAALTACVTKDERCQKEQRERLHILELELGSLDKLSRMIPGSVDAEDPRVEVLHGKALFPGPASAQFGCSLTELHLGLAVL